MNLFITGTDTDAGKTTVSAWICSKIKTTYWKPIQTGADADADVIQKFAPQTEILPNAYRLKAPLSAWDAARLEQKTIDVLKLKTDRDKMLIEGAGGLLVPIAEKFFMLDVIEQTHATALVIARSKLGMINHLLLTIFALHQRKIPVLGIIICGDIERNIRETIEHFSKVRILAILPETNDLRALFEQTPLPSEILKVLS